MVLSLQNILVEPPVCSLAATRQFARPLLTAELMLAGFKQVKPVEALGEAALQDDNPRIWFPAILPIMQLLLGLWGVVDLDAQGLLVLGGSPSISMALPQALAQQCSPTCSSFPCSYLWCE